MQDLYTFHVDEVTHNGTVVGSLRNTGLRPTFGPKLERHGIKLGPTVAGISAPMNRLISR